MSSKSLYVYDTYEAITNGTIPGTFNSNHTVFSFPTIRSVNSHGKTLLWTISVSLQNVKGDHVRILVDYLKQPIKQLEDLVGVISVDAGQDGRPARKAVNTFVTKGKNVGSKNATNVITQAFRDALGKYNNKIKTASELTIDEEKANMFPPMLIKKQGDTRQATITETDISNGVIVQEKLNGIRMVAYFHNNEVILYSRKLSIIPDKQHIRNDLMQLFEIAKNLGYQGIYFDGEIYKKGLNLQDISGQSRRSDTELDLLLEYHIFDCFFPNNLDLKTIDRQTIIDQIFAKNTGTHVVRVPNIIPASFDEAMILKDQIIKNGGEGIIIRRKNNVYTYSYNNKRTSDVVKFKAKFDEEYECIGYTSGKGKYLGVVIWICQTKDKQVFNVDQKDMTIEYRKKLYTLLGQTCMKDTSKTNFEYYLKGLSLTLEFEELSKTGVPQRAKAVMFRSYETDHDPAKELFAMID